MAASESEEMRHVKWPKFFGSTPLHVVVCATRNGNNAFWKWYLQALLDVMFQTRTDLQESGQLKNYAETVVLSIDGEHGFLTTAEGELPGFEDKGVRIIKTGGGSTAANQPNDAMKNLHPVLKAAGKSPSLLRR
jgi:hypothetical protein